MHSEQWRKGERDLSRFNFVNRQTHGEFLRHLLAALTSLAVLLACALAQAETGADTVDVSRLEKGTLGLYSHVISEGQTRLTLDDVRALYHDGRFVPGTRPVLSFGLDAAPVWVHLSLVNPSDQPVRYFAILGATWIDHVDVYLDSAAGLTGPMRLGDTLPGALGTLPGIGLGLPLTLPAGRSELYLRAQTSDPLLLPIELLPERELAAQGHGVHYAYGALYGFLLALIIYNCILFFGMRKPSYLYYSLYVLAFIAMNLSYTGHGFVFLWPEHPDFQRFVIFAAIMIYSASGLFFASSFLDLSHYAPRLFRWVRGFAVAGVLAMGFCIALDSQPMAGFLAFSHLTSVTFIMVALGVHAVLAQRPAGTYFLVATLFGMLGAAATTISVWGTIPYNQFTYHGIEVGIVLEATLLALALARQVRFDQIARVKAEFSAQHDPLTGLFNRRAFVDLSQSVWAQCKRHARPLSVLILDIDHFKQVNDLHGHEGGDNLLRSVSQVLESGCRRGDVLARWGGEEFLYLLPETDTVQARLLAERIRQRIEETEHPSKDKVLRCTVSIGIASYTDDVSLDALIARADAYLYKAKAGGRNQVCS